MHENEGLSLNGKISDFIDRKARQYPDLRLLEKWGKYEYTPRARSGISSHKELTQ